MKKALIVIAILVTLSLVAIYLSKNKPQPNSSISNLATPTVLPINPTNSYSNTPTTFEQKTSNNFNVEYIIVRDPKKIFLYDNSTEKLTSADALKKYECDKIISGGFWREDNGESIELLISEGKVIKNKTSNSLFDSFFYINNDGITKISSIEPDNTKVRIALQSGPMLVDQKLPLTISPASDENARRIVVAKTTKGETVFLVFYYKPSPFVGPKLHDLPILLDDLTKNTNLKIENALNLDGGGHSAFISGDINITEISRVGSFFCIKP